MTAKKTIRTATYAVYAILLALTVYFATRTVIAFTAPQSLWTNFETPLIAANAPQARNQQALNLAFDPFHRNAANVPVDAGKDAPETTLNLKLLGRRAGPNGTAILKTPDNKQNVFSIGDEIISGVTLKSVTPEFIVLSLDGRLERLTFMRDHNSGLIAAPREAASTNISARTTAQKSFTAADFLSAVSIEQVTEGGSVKGFRIIQRDANYNLTDYGLKSGDIITNIGSTDLTRGQPNFQTMMTAINASQTLSMTLMRGGSTMTITVK